MGCEASTMGEVGSPSIQYEAGNNNEENIVCQICNVCFNTKERAPLIICPSNHSVCKECFDSFSKKNLTRCPFCRVDLNFEHLQPNQSLVVRLGKHESEEKGYVRNNPSLMSEQELRRWTSDEAKKYNYLGVYEKVLNRHTNPLNNYTMIREEKHKLNTPIDLTVFPNLKTLDFRKTWPMQDNTNLKPSATLATS